MAKIKQITAREILNAKGNPAIEATVVLSDDATGTASCPANTVVGSYEAFVMYDHDDARYQGLGMLKAIENIETIIAPKLLGIEATKQQLVDRIMIDLDGTQNKSKLGANAILSVSMAVAKASAASSVLPLFLYLREFISIKNTAIKIPIPLFTCFSGSPTLDFQEFILVPATSQNYSDALQIGTTTYMILREQLRIKNLSLLTSFEGGFGPSLGTNTEALAFLQSVIANTSLRLGFDVFLGIDAAASFFYKNQQYRIKDKDSGLSAKAMNDFYMDLVKQFHILYLEDPFAEDDWDGWKHMIENLSQEAIVIGDDLTTTNPYRLQMAIDKKAITGIVIKPNQVGTVIESLAVVEVARAAGMKIIVSDRSGETNDDFIADFAVAVGADYIKCCSPTRGEHVAKYNRLLQIESQLKLLQL